MIKNILMYSVPAVSLIVAGFFVYQFYTLRNNIIQNTAVIQQLISVDSTGATGFDKAVIQTLNKIQAANKNDQAPK